MTTAQIEEKFDHGIWLALNKWDVLRQAVHENWGGGNSEEKRDQFAGAISTLFTDNKTKEDAYDSEWLELYMLQIMDDEFGCNVEDFSGEKIADLIIELRKETLAGDFTQVDQLCQKWQEDQKSGKLEKLSILRGEDPDQETDDSEEWESNDDEDGDVMNLDQPAKPPKEKIVPTVDEDGFTQVVSKKRR